MNFDAAGFHQRLAETIAWCTWRLARSVEEHGEMAWRSCYDPRAPQVLVPRDLAGCLRTPELGPLCVFDYTDEQKLPPPVDARRVEMVEALALKRAELLRWANVFSCVASGDLARGRILVYEPDITLFDGASYAETAGFIDGEDARCNDVPPWDLWISFVASAHRSFLLSYVPPSLLALVGSGVDATCSGCLFWLDAPEDAYDSQRTSNLELLAHIAALTHD